MAESKVLEKRRKSSRKPFKLMARIPGAKAASVTGDFTGWSEEGIPMAQQSDDQWEIDLIVSPGEHEYRLRVDGEWRDHEEAEKRVPNPFGSENCILFAGE